MSAEAAFVAEYNAVLKGLVRNEKPQINMLSMLAEDNKDFAAGIVGVINQHILTCPPPAKLPALYLVDSIVKNVGEPYKSKFSERLPEVFGAVWDTTLQDARSSLSRLFGTWTGVLPPHVLQQVSNRMVASSSRSSNGGQQPAPTAVQPQPAPAMVAAVQQLRPQMPVLLPPFAVAGQPMQVVQQQQQGPPQFFGLQQSVLGMPQQQTFVQINGTLVPVNALQPQQVVLQPAPPQLVSQQVPQHVTPHHAMQQHTTPQHTMQAVPAAVRPPVSPGHHSWQQPPPPPPQQQQLQVGPGPMVRRAPGSPAAPAQLDGMRGPPPPPRGRQEAGRKSASPMPNSAELTNDALSKLLSNLATKGVLAAKNEAAAVRKATEFQPAFLKEMHAGVLQHLEELSAITRPIFRDVEFQRNKRRSATAGAAVSRTWYLAVDTWIAGTLATEEGIAHNPFEDDEDASGSGQEEEALEPEDPEQPCCAISGEPFDKVFNQDSEQWFFRGAKRILGDEAKRYGVPDGSLVKVKCLAEAGLGSGAAAMLAAGGASGSGDVEAMLAAAAAEAPAAGQAAPPAAAAAAPAAAQAPSSEGAVTPAAAAVSPPAAAAAAAAAIVAETEQQEPQQDAAVKQEQLHNDADVKAEIWQHPKQEESTREGAEQQVGSKREAGSPGALEGGEVGSAAKRAKLEQSP